MTRPFLPLPGVGDPVCYSNTSVQSVGCSANNKKITIKVYSSKYVSFINRVYWVSHEYAKIVGRPYSFVRVRLQRIV